MNLQEAILWFTFQSFIFVRKKQNTQLSVGILSSEAQDFSHRVKDFCLSFKSFPGIDLTLGLLSPRSLWKKFLLCPLYMPHVCWVLLLWICDLWQSKNSDTVPLNIMKKLYFTWFSQKQSTLNMIFVHSIPSVRLYDSLKEGHFYRGIYKYDSSNKQLKIIYEAFANYPSWAVVVVKDNLWFSQNTLQIGSFICDVFNRENISFLVLTNDNAELLI